MFVSETRGEMHQVNNCIINRTHNGGNYLPVTDQERSIISFGTRQVFEMVNYMIVCSIIGLLGIAANSINMIVFCKQGFKNTMTISFMALAISDMCCLVTLLWFCICMNPLLASSRIPFVPLEIHSPTAGWPHITSVRITGWITAYVTAERCLCITAPLAVRAIIIPKRTTCILIGIYVINIITVLPVYVTSHMGWKFYPEKNRTLLGLIMTSDNEKAEGVVFLLHAVLVLTSFMCVTVLTSVLVIKLKGASQWRLQATQSKAQSEAISAKDKKATRMVVMISGLQIVMNSPGILLSLATFCEPKFGIFGVYKNLFFAVWSFGFVCNALNSSLNIFMYYTMSSKYKDIFNQIFRVGGQRKS